MKILFTGASSFTGYWFVKTLAEAGHEVTSTFTSSDIESYSGTRKERISLNSGISRQVFDCRFGSGKFISVLKEGNFDLLCHHAADVTDYKSPGFNVFKALESNTYNLAEVLKNINREKFSGIIFTGSVFESEEGAGGEAETYLDAFSPYGLSKALTFRYFKYYCSAYNIRLGKFVIPNPFGPYEEPRFTAYLIKTWSAGKTAEVNTPLYYRDNIHADLLAAVYSYFIKMFSGSVDRFMKINPSGYAELMSAFTKRFSDEMRRRLNLACEFKLNDQQSFSEPMKRINTEPAAEIINDWNEKKAWDNLAEYYKRGMQL